MMAARRGASGHTFSAGRAPLLPLLALCVACSGVDDDRPPLAPGCSVDCGQPGKGGPGAGSGGSDGSGGMGGAPVATDLTGVVVAMNDEAFAQTAAFSGAATVFAESPTLAQGVSGTYDGASFSLADALQDRRAWVAVRPDDVAAFIDTISYQDTTETSVTAPLVSRALLQEIYFNLSTPAELAANAAQLVVRVFEANGAGVVGVTANTTAGTFAAYSADGTFSETETVTDGQGIIILGNIAATRFPGSEFVLRLGGAAEAELTVRIAQGAVTLVDVVLVP